TGSGSPRMSSWAPASRSVMVRYSPRVRACSATFRHGWWLGAIPRYPCVPATFEKRPMQRSEIAGYRWETASLTCAHDYLLPAVRHELARLCSADNATAGGEGCSISAAATEALPTNLRSSGGT